MNGQLREFEIGRAALVVAVDLSEKERLRLESMGILPGVEISVLARGAGPLIVAVGDSRVMIEADIAERILVV